MFPRNANLKLLQKLQRELTLSYLLITHNFAVLLPCGHVAVMYRGKIVEHGAVEQVLNHPHIPILKNIGIDTKNTTLSENIHMNKAIFYLPNTRAAGNLGKITLNRPTR